MYIVSVQDRVMSEKEKRSKKCIYIKIKEEKDMRNTRLFTCYFLLVSIRNQGSIEDKTICMTGKQFISDHYNVHSLYGHTEAIETMK